MTLATSKPAAGVPVTTGVTGRVLRARVGEDRDVHLRRRRRSTLTGLTGLPSWSTGGQRDVLVDVEAVGLDRRRSPGPRRPCSTTDAGPVTATVSGSTVVAPTSRPRAACRDRRRPARSASELVELDGHHVRLARRGPDPRVGGGHDDRDGLGPAPGWTLAEVDGGHEGRGDRAGRSAARSSGSADRLEGGQQERVGGWLTGVDRDRPVKVAAALGQDEAAVEERREADRGELEGPVVDDDPDESGHRGARAAEVVVLSVVAIASRGPGGGGRGWDRAGCGSPGRAAPR